MISRRGLFAFALVCVAGVPVIVRAQDEEAPPEMYRIRLVNEAGGPIEISGDKGTTWEPLGKVTSPASATSIASNVVGIVPQSSVAAVLPTSLLIRLPAAKTVLRSLRIAAKGEPDSTAAIATDIPPRGSLFRCAAPPIGSSVLVERPEGTVPLPTPYTPRAGDRLLIVVTMPPPGEAATVTIENKVDGEVVLTRPMALPRLLGRVKQPLKGIGRYAGTERAGSGRVQSWSPTAVVVSTAGTKLKLDAMGEPEEERGGFVIQPSEPALQGTTHPASQLLIQAVPEENGRPPISPFFGLPLFLSTSDALELMQTRVEVRIDEGAWEPVPDLRGTILEADFNPTLQKALGAGRTCKTGITHIRLICASMTAASVKRRLLMATTPLEESPQRGKVTITANVVGDGIREVDFLLNGQLVRATNIPPYLWEWDTRALANGEHLLEVQGLDERRSVITSARRRVIVDN